eukprot:19398-Heterococcus_DN1.PRE.4
MHLEAAPMVSLRISQYNALALLQVSLLVVFVGVHELTAEQATAVALYCQRCCAAIDCSTSGSNVSAEEQSNKGVTPLYIAADRSTPQTVAALLTAGAAVVWDHK